MSPTEHLFCFRVLPEVKRLPVAWWNNEVWCLVHSVRSFLHSSTVGVPFHPFLPPFHFRSSHSSFPFLIFFGTALSQASRSSANGEVILRWLIRKRLLLDETHSFISLTAAVVAGGANCVPAVPVFLFWYQTGCCHHQLRLYTSLFVLGLVARSALLLTFMPGLCRGNGIRLPCCCTHNIRQQTYNIKASIHCRSRAAMASQVTHDHFMSESLHAVVGWCPPAAYDQALIIYQCRKGCQCFKIAAIGRNAGWWCVASQCPMFRCHWVYCPIPFQSVHSIPFHPFHSASWTA